MNKFVKGLLITAAVLAVAIFGFMTYTKSHSPAATIETKAGNLEVSVDYCQPQRKDRKIFGELVPYGKVWRTGANAATIITLNRDATFAGESVKAGKYTLWTIPNENEWTIILNKETGQWGTNYDEGKDLFRTSVPAEKTSEMTEQFTMKFAPTDGGTDLILAWENTKVVIPVR